MNHRNFHDLSGMKFGSLLIVKRGENKSGRSAWECVCKCGKSKVILSCNITSGKSLSCGKCLDFESHKKTYRVWSSMKSRCQNKNHKFFSSYGGRGIDIHKSWNYFQNFLKDMGESPEGLTLDRIDNNKGYYKENCRWTTMMEQRNNIRSNRILEFKGRKQTMAQWAREIGINYKTLKSRLNISKMSVEKALSL